MGSLIVWESWMGQFFLWSSSHQSMVRGIGTTIGQLLSSAVTVFTVYWFVTIKWESWITLWVDQIQYTTTTHLVSVWSISMIPWFFSHLQFLLADSAFTISTHCISAFKCLCGVHSLPEDEGLFNTLLAKARIRVEHCIGLLNNQFQCLRGNTYYNKWWTKPQKDHW